MKRGKQIGAAFVGVYRATAVVLLNILVLLVLLEVSWVSLRGIKRAFFDAPPPETDWTYVLPAYPGMSLDEVTDLKNSAEKRIGYEKWLQFRTVDVQSKYTNAKGFERKTEGSSEDPNHRELYFFGGSTTYGFGVPDADTLPSKFAQLSQQTGEAFRVRNFGQPYYASAQELRLFIELFAQGHRPDVAIFLDGLNESVQMGSSYADEPFWSPVLAHFLGKRNLPLRELIEQGPVSQLLEKSQLFLGLRSRLVEQSYQNPWTMGYQQPTDQSLGAVGDRIIDNFKKNLAKRKLFCELFQVRCFSFWQPVPVYAYDQREPVSYSEPLKIVEYVYSKVENQILNGTDGLRGVVFLGRMLESTEVEYPFVDKFHYSGPFHAEIANRILQTVQSDTRVMRALSSQSSN